MWSIIVFLTALFSDNRAAIAAVAAIGLGLTMTVGLSNRFDAASYLGNANPNPATIFGMSILSIIVLVLIARALRWGYFKIRGLPAPRFI